MLDVMYLTYNRLEFTRFTLRLLRENTDWSLVRKLVVYDDGSDDGTLQHVRDALIGWPVPVELHVQVNRSPVLVMNRYCAITDAHAFAKIDNDIAVPPGWLEALTSVLDANPGLELLGMEAGFPGVVDDEAIGYTWAPSTHIGGVGLMRTSAFQGRRAIPVRGRFGFQEWQDKFDVVRGWITPELMVPQLDRVPEEPWLTLSEQYLRRGWQRAWPKYDARYTQHYYNWWPREEAA